MNRREFYFNQELKKDDLNDAFDLASNSMVGRLNDVTAGIIRGCAVNTGVVSGWNLTITSGAVSAADHINFPGGVVDVSLDHNGASTLPSSGHYRWVAVAIRYGQLLASSAVDGLGVTVYQHRTDSYNVNGTSLLADATATTNNAGDAKLYVVAGTEAATGSALTLPSVPGDAVILCDILITNGQSAIDFAGGAVYHGRRSISTKTAQSGNAFPSDPAISRFDYQLIWAIEGHSIKTRFYQGLFAMVITTNAAWTPETTTTAVPFGPTGVWTADNTGFPATKYTLFDGIVAERKHSADVGTPWTDAAQSTSGWDSYAELGRGTTRSTYTTIDGNGNVTGKGVITGYVSVVGTGSALGTAIQFPRQFTATPSSVTLGAAGPGEVSNANVTSVATGNLSKYGCDFTVVPTNITIVTISQRPYTATL